MESPPRGQGEQTRPGLQQYVGVILAFLEPLVRDAERRAVIFALENEGSTVAGTCAEARAIGDAIGMSPGVTFCWDINNGIGCGESAFPDGYAQIKGRISHLHVKPNENQALDPVAGSRLTYVELLRKVLADGYSGAASIEHWGSPESMLKGVRELRAAADNL